MAINGVLNFKDKNGDITTVYPVTSAENVAGLSAALAGKVDKEAGKGLSANDYTTTEKNKLAGIEAGANAYTLPAATSSTLGGVKQGENITIAADGTISTANYTLPKATTTSLGGIQVGTDLNIDSSTGSLSVNKTSSVTSGSGELVTSGGVYAALENKVDKVSGKGLSSNDYSDNEKNKLSSIEAGAEVNVQADWNQTTSTADDYIKNKPTLGTAAAASASDFATAAQGTKADNAIPSSAKGTANGVAELDSNGLVPASQLPSFVDDVLEYASAAGFPVPGENGKIYVAIDTNLSYRWSGSAYVEISPSLALGTTESTAYRGDRGQTAYEHATDNSRLTTAKTSGLYKIAATAEGHVASATPVTKSDITALGIPAQDTTYSEATTSTSGLMSASDKSKLNGIEAQANKTVVDSSLSSSSTNPVQNKVINTALAGKADASEVNAALALKADASTVSSLSSQVSTNTTDIATQTARIDEITTLPSGSTSGDAELIDGRVGADGTVYTNIGGAIRGQIDNIESLVAKREIINLTWNIGGLRLDGSVNPENTTRAYTSFVPRDKIKLIVPVANGYKFRIAYYYGSTFLNFSDWFEDASQAEIAENGTNLRLLVGYKDDRTIISTDDIANKIKLYSVQYGDGCYQFRNEISNLGVTALSNITDIGVYNATTPTAQTISDLPDDVTGAFILIVNKWYSANGPVIHAHQTLITTDNVTYTRWLSENNVFIDWKKSGEGSVVYQGDITDKGYNTLAECSKIGVYSGRKVASALPDAPKINAAFTLIVSHWFNGTSRDNISQILVTNGGTVFTRFLQRNGTVVFDWSSNNDSMRGLTVAVIGDSISTNGNDGENANVPELTITEEDVGVQLSAYLTYYDVQNNLSIGGHTYTSSEIGTEVTFTPLQSDVGKSIGVPNNYNPNATTVWWEIMKDELGCDVIPVCWSGSSITSHEQNIDTRKTSHAWHEAQIRKCGIRTPGTMNRTEPDAIIIYRGTNDFSHEPYALLTDGYPFDSLSNPVHNDDTVDGGYGYKEGLIKTISALRNRYKNAKIILCTLNIFKRVNTAYPVTNGYNSLPQYNQAIREVADYMGCGLIEFDKDGITYSNCYSEGYIVDSETIPTHPSNKGHKVMGLKAIADIKAHFSKMA